MTDESRLVRLLPPAWAFYGFASMLLQVVFLREFLVVFQGNELWLGAALALWLFGVSLGGAFWGLAADRLGGYRSMLGLVFMLYALAGAAPQWLLPLIWTLPHRLGGGAGETLGLFQLLAGGAIALTPLGFVLGGFFPVHNRLALGSESGGGRLARVYVSEALGAAAAGVVFTFFLAETAPAPVLLMALTAGCFLVGFGLLIFPGPGLGPGSLAFRGLVFLFIAGGGVAACFAAAGMTPLHIERLWRGYSVLEVHESRFGRVWVLTRGGETTLFENGGIVGHFPDYETGEDLLYWGALQFEPDELGHVLIIGGGATVGSNPGLDAFPNARFLYMDLNDELIDAVKRHVPDGLDAFEPDDIIYRDPRARWRPPAPLDLVIVALPDPTTARINRFYTRDFFALVKSRLGPDGVMSISISGSAGYPSELRARLLAVIKKTLEAEFEQALLIPSSHSVFLATNRQSPLLADQWEYEDRLLRHDIRTAFFGSRLLNNLNPLRTGLFADALAAHADAELNTDDAPAAYLTGMLLEAEEQKSPALALLLRARGLGWRTAAGAVVGFFAALALIGLGLKSVRPAAATAVMVTGFLEMGFEVLLLLAFQSLFGYVYGMMGLILAAFMAGLMLGGRSAARGGSEPGALTRRMAAALGLMAVTVAALAALVVLRNHPLAMRWAVAVQWLFPLLALCAGVAGGGLFVLAGRRLIDPGRPSAAKAGLLYGFDLMGSCLGALTVAVVFVPVWGLSRTALLGVLTAALMALTLLLPAARRTA